MFWWAGEIEQAKAIASDLERPESSPGAPAKLKKAVEEINRILRTRDDRRSSLDWSF
jgi:hypothetical protein